MLFRISQRHVLLLIIAFFSATFFFPKKFKIELLATFIQEGINANSYFLGVLLLVCNVGNITTLGSFPIHMSGFRDRQHRAKLTYFENIISTLKMRGSFRAYIQLCF